MIKVLAMAMMWVVAFSAIPARDAFFNGKIYVWPFLLASCAIAALYNWRMAAVIAVAILGDQAIQRILPNPEIAHVIWFATVAFIALWLFDVTAAGIAAAVSLCYLIVVVGADWRTLMIISEVMIVAGMCLGVFVGPTGGIRHQSMDAGAPPHPAVTAVRRIGGFDHPRVSLEDDPS